MPNRYLMVDSLRGIAALAVVFLHLTWAAFRGFENSPVISDILDVAKWGFLGVPIFFVISGFVIAATLKQRAVNFTYTGKFIAKRAIRLDPPYWLSIALDISLLVIAINVFGMAGELPSASAVFAHLFYAQELLGIPHIGVMYWTLCLEVQFYIFLCLTFLAANKLKSAHLPAVVIAVTALASLAISSGYVRNPIPGLFLSHWYLFVLGAVCYWTTISRQVSGIFFFAYIALCIAAYPAQSKLNFDTGLGTIVALATALLLFAAVHRDKMSSWLNNRVLLYFGSISYSLYLFHSIVGERFIALLQEVLLPKLGLQIQSSLYALALFVGAFAVSVITAHFVYMLVERPTTKLSKRIKPDSQMEMPTMANPKKSSPATSPTP